MQRDPLLMKLGAAQHDLTMQPILHRTAARIEAHIVAAFLADCLQVPSKAGLRPVASGTTPREVIATFTTTQRVDVPLPTTDGRGLTLSRCTQPEAEHRIPLDPLRLNLPGQPPPQITTAQVLQRTADLVMAWRPAALGHMKSTHWQHCRG